jgi:hypothetical protein
MSTSKIGICEKSSNKTKKAKGRRLIDPKMEEKICKRLRNKL